MKKYPVITLCGSTRFKKVFTKAQKSLTLEGNIVISIGLFGHSGDQEVWENMDEGTLTKTKEMLDDMHKRKIDMADEYLAALEGKKASLDTSIDELIGATADEIQEITKDFILKELSKKLKGYDSENFVANLLNAMGYRT